MAVYSMTGYASAATALATSTSSEIQLSVEIRSVNSRFLDISFRLPDELRQSEPALRTLITANIKRGKVELRAALENTLQNLPVRPSVADIAAAANDTKRHPNHPERCTRTERGGCSAVVRLARKCA